MQSTATKGKGIKGAKQKIGLYAGNEMAALAGAHINFHIMGYFPITPSTQIAEELDAMKAEGKHDVVMIPADGEHGAAGICFGATCGGGRVTNATSANGLLYSIEQLPVQSGTRMPMILNLITRSVSGPLDIRCDHSDLYMALNCGWIILCAKDSQAVYDMNMIAVKIGELMDVRLPVIVASDGFFTSHQKRKVKYFSDSKEIQEYLGEFKPVYHALDPENPITIGPYMNDPDLINNKKQQSMAMEAAYRELPGIFEEFEAFSGRKYSLIDSYRMEDADAALFILNSAADTARTAVDVLREKGKKVGMVMPTVIRPFPLNEIRAVFRSTKSIMVADRADSYGAGGGNMTLEVKAALKDDPDNKSLILSRIFGLGGKEYFIEDAIAMFEETLDAAAKGSVQVPFDYYGANPGEEGYTPKKVIEPLSRESVTLGTIQTERDPETGEIKVKGVRPRDLTGVYERFSSGHGACPGCGIFSSLSTFLKGIEGHVVVMYHTGCGMVVTTGYPYSSHNVTYIHNLFQNGAATMSGLVEMFHERKRRGELPEDEEITFIMITGDGGNDIGMGPAIGAALRNHNMIMLEYDNEAYSNTGFQLSYSTPLGHSTSTSHVGPKQCGKRSHHKDTAQIMAATNIPYVFTATEANYRDLIKKAAKAQRISREEGFVFGKILSLCPLGWRSEEDKGVDVLNAAVNSNFFPLYEVYNGVTTINYDPEAKEKKVHVSEWLNLMGKSRHMLRPENKAELDSFSAEVERRWKRLKALSEAELL